MLAHLLNELRNSNNMLGQPLILSLFPNPFDKFIITREH